MDSNDVLTMDQELKIDEIKALLYSPETTNDQVINATTTLQDPEIIQGIYIQIKSEQAARYRYVATSLGIESLDELSQTEIISSLTQENKEGAIARLLNKYPNISQITQNLTNTEINEQLRLISICEKNLKIYSIELLKKTRVNNILGLLNSLDSQALTRLYSLASNYIEQVKTSKNDDITSSPAIPIGLTEMLKQAKLDSAVTNKELLEIINFLKNILVVSGVLAQAKTDNINDLEKSRGTCAELMYQLGYRPDFEKLF